ncbi:hypothetical protein ACT7V1_004165 [Salmonella enterica subsp. enterica]|nr:hypothetical protein [Salmonella enterica subsp. enterica serovar Suberu]ECM8230949.1 hypothetical protein [Salmonella enterica subsp. enterica serovar Kentucky]EHW9667340.1 hypothetical protein [Salmonella enterica subsp. enterica serovar Agbeni]EIU1267270.1 hypothetical protein [Salmonella enterica subsp. enterica serovar Agbeni]
MNAHNLDGLSANDFHVVALENINVAMRAALGSKTKYSKSGNTIIFNNDCRWNDRADLSPYTSTAVVQADYAGLEYREISREAIEDYRADLLASRPDLRDMLEREFAEIDAVFLRVEKEAQLREAWERVRAEAEEQAAKRAAFAAQLGGIREYGSNNRQPIEYPALSEIFGRRNEDGFIDVLYKEEGYPVARIDAPINVVAGTSCEDDRSVRVEHPEGITITEGDARAIGLEIEQ